MKDETSKLPECTPRLFNCGQDFDCSERLDMLKNAVLKGTYFESERSLTHSDILCRPNAEDELFSKDGSVALQAHRRTWHDFNLDATEHYKASNEQA